MNKFEFYAKCYFVLRRFPLAEEFYENAYTDKSKSISQHVDEYCKRVMQNPATAFKIDEDFDNALTEYSEKHFKENTNDNQVSWTRV